MIANRNYLAGRHKVLQREDSHYKGKVFIVRKTILNYAKTVIRFINILTGQTDTVIII